MAKRKRPSDSKDKSQNESDLQENGAGDEVATATAVEAPPSEKPQAPQAQQGRSPDQPAGNLGEDVATLDAETNAKYEQVKGGKLYIKDLQQMEVHALHEIAKA